MRVIWRESRPSTSGSTRVSITRLRATSAMREKASPQPTSPSSVSRRTKRVSKVSGGAPPHPHGARGF